ncbi:POP4 like ribonuclease P protein subunit [Cryptosporidium ryanae]|uniref:POP4 like ribonuclease P protein subunit n=1 Tax=Cryptosporidium ryanae TaxID=515981 RepID=UPI00351A1FD7|nr:POP4 like ribonuclease P protein subunit [Cryptosporidium ryanae]
MSGLDGQRGHPIYDVFDKNDTKELDNYRKSLFVEFDRMSEIEKKTRKEIKSFLEVCTEEEGIFGTEGLNPKITGVSTKVIRMDKVKGFGMSVNNNSGELIKSKSRPVNHKIKRNEGFFDVLDDIRKRNLGYVHFVPLHSLWKQYILGLTGGEGRKGKLKLSQLSQFVSQADFHGSIIKVISSRNKECINVEGIVIKETKETFLVISKDNKPRTLLKNHTIFSMEFNNYVIVLYGTQLCYHPSERIKHKFRHKESLNIL